jgi:hypothetical protein
MPRSKLGPYWQVSAIRDAKFAGGGRARASQMKAIHLAAYDHSTQDLRLVELSEPDTPSAGVSGGNACARLRNPSGSIGWLMKPHD